MAAIVAMAALSTVSTAGVAAELRITIGGQSVTYTAAQLLVHPGVMTITTENDAAYKRAMTYRAVPVATLLPGLGPQDSVRFVANDGFAATLPAAPLLLASDDAARAYLAIETPDAPWPSLKPGSPATAGSFYLVWLHPERGRITQESWPYQVATIEDVPPLTRRFPTLLPDPDAAIAVQRGLQVFVSNCSVCHSLNLAGDARVGPDLNVPYSPTEYLREESLRRLIRGPQTLRSWPDSKMPAFDVKTINARELEDLLAYMRHMAKRKVPVLAK
ncbi:MAG: cytochrome c [Gemmatimonadaceae bacterium]